MMFVLWISITAIVGVIVGALFSGKISKAVKSLETTVEAKLTAIETAINARSVHTVFTAESAFKNPGVTDAVRAVLKAAEQTAKI